MADKYFPQEFMCMHRCLWMTNHDRLLTASVLANAYIAVMAPVLVKVVYFPIPDQETPMEATLTLI